MRDGAHNAAPDARAKAAAKAGRHAETAATVHRAAIPVTVDVAGTPAVAAAGEAVAPGAVVTTVTALPGVTQVVADVPIQRTAHPA